MKVKSSETFCGQAVSRDQLSEIVEIVETFSKLSRGELANTICELFCWKRPTGKLKTVECRQFLERLEARGLIRLPPRRNRYRKRKKAGVARTPQADRRTIVTAKLFELSPVTLLRIETKKAKTAMVRVHRSLSLSGVQNTLWRPITVFHSIRYETADYSRVPAILQSGLEDGTAGSMDRLERSAATAQLTKDR